MIYVGDTIIFRTGGAAAPIVFAAAVVGGSCIVYGMSNLDESMDQMDKAAHRDITTPSSNFLRDTIFGGNQKMYDTWGEINMTASMFIMPLNSSVNALSRVDDAAGIAQKVWEFGKTMTVEVGKMAVNYKLSTEAGQYVTEHTGSQYLGSAVETLFSFALDFGMDGIQHGLDSGQSQLEKTSRDNQKSHNKYKAAETRKQNFRSIIEDVKDRGRTFISNIDDEVSLFYSRVNSGSSKPILAMADSYTGNVSLFDDFTYQKSTISPKNDHVFFADGDNNVGSKSGNTSWLAKKNGDVDWRSTPNFGHTFSTHGEGSKNTKALLDRAKTPNAKGEYVSQGQWLNNQAAAEYLDTYGKIEYSNPPIEIPIPKGCKREIKMRTEMTK